MINLSREIQLELLYLAAEKGMNQAAKEFTEKFEDGIDIENVEFDTTLSVKAAKMFDSTESNKKEVKLYV